MEVMPKFSDLESSFYNNGFTNIETEKYFVRKDLQDLFLYAGKERPEFYFDEKNVVLCGANGRGKTNILEAISILSIGKSWRESSPTDLIREKQSSALIAVKTSSGSQFRVTISPRSRKF